MPRQEVYASAIVLMSQEARERRLGVVTTREKTRAESKQHARLFSLGVAFDLIRTYAVHFRGYVQRRALYMMIAGEIFTSWRIYVINSYAFAVAERRGLVKVVQKMMVEGLRIWSSFAQYQKGTTHR